MRPAGKHPDFVVRQEEPFNGGPPLARLIERFRTPNDLFYVRSHGAVPAVDPAAYRLAVTGRVRRPLALSLDELRGFGRQEVAATLQCAGNRRDELMAAAPIPGELPWSAEAIGNASWAGVPLAALLAAAEPEPEAGHVAFAGLDEAERHGHRFRFGGSIPLEKALAPEVLLASEMNGLPLPPAHGFPLRAVVPGYIGARSVKWLAEIRLQAEPSDNYFQAKAYRLFPSWIGPETVDWETGLMLGELPVNSVICAPAAFAAVAAGPVEARGYAVVGSGRTVARVDLSGDGGATWTAAELLPAEGDPGDGRWSWRLWRGTVRLAPGERELAVRAWDSAAQGQPEDVAQVWNFKGYMNNAWHRVRVRCAG